MSKVGTGLPPKLKEIKDAIKEGFEKGFGIKIVKGGLTKYERGLLGQKIKKFRSDEWIYRVRGDLCEQQILTSAYKSKGGLIQISPLIVYPLK